MQKGRALEPDVHESGLHSGQHPGNAALVQIADEPAAAHALDVDFLENAVFKNGRAGLA